MISEEETARPLPVIAISGLRYSVWEHTVRFSSTAIGSFISGFASRLIDLSTVLNLPDGPRLAEKSADAFHCLSMGAVWRKELRSTTRLFLEQILDGLSNRGIRAKFSRLFKPRGEWLIDSFDFASRRLASECREGLANSLSCLKDELIPHSLAGTEPRLGVLSPEVAAAYSLYRLRITQPRKYFAYLRRMTSLDPLAAHALKEVTAGLMEAQHWFRRVISFFLYERWLSESSGQYVSLFDLIQRFWHLSPELPLPEIGVTSLGYPDARFVNNSGTSILNAVLKGANDSGRDYLGNLSSEQRLALLTDLPIAMRIRLSEGETVREVLSWKAFLRLGLVGRKARLLFDPAVAIGNLPELVVHELQHWVLSQLRSEHLSGQKQESLLRWEVDSTVEEGFAELFSNEILGWAFERFPLLRFFNHLRLLSLCSRDANDPHVWGFLTLSDIYKGLGYAPGALVACLAGHDFLLDRLMAEGRIPKLLSDVDSHRYSEWRSVRSGTCFQMPGLCLEIDQPVRVKSVNLTGWVNP